MKENFLKHFAVIGTGTVISMLLGLLTTPIITRLIEPIEYGRFSIFNTYSEIALMVLCLGLDQALVRYYYESDSLVYKRTLLHRCIKYPVIASIICMIFFVPLVKEGIIPFEFDVVVTSLLCIFIFIKLIYRFSVLVVRLEYNSKFYSLLSVLRKLVYVVCVLSLIYMTRNNSIFLLIISTLIAEITVLFLSIFKQWKIWSLGKAEKGGCIVSEKELLLYAYPFILSMSISTLFEALDRLSLNYFRTYEEVGIYAAAMTLVNLFALIQSTFNTLWAPMAVKHYAEDPNDRSYYQKGNKVITVIMFFIGISLILIKDIFSLLLGAKYREAAYILPFLIFHPIMYTISETTVGGLVFMKKSKLQVVVAAGACTANLIGNMILVPILGGKGAALSTGISYIIFFTLRTLLSNRYFYIDYGLKKFFVLTLVVFVYAAYNTFFYFNAGAIIGYLICLAILILLYNDTVKWMWEYVINALRNLKYRKI